MEIKFVLSESLTPDQIRDAIKGEVKRRLGNVQNVDHSSARKEAETRGEIYAYSGIVRFLDNLVFQ